MNVTLLGDIAGRISEDSFEADRVTAATVCVPTGATKSIRGQIPAHFPKWSEASNSHVELVVKLLLREALAICVMSLNKTTTEWTTFWAEAAETHRRISNKARGSVSVLKAALMIKVALYGQCSTLAVAHSVKVGKLPRPASQRQILHVRESHIYDREIDGDENVQAFLEAWAARNQYQPLTNLLGVKLEAVSVHQLTEQAEPLLLLADYGAGIAHAAHSSANTLSASAVTPDCARRAYASLRTTSGYTEIAEDFNLRYYDIYAAFAPRAENAP